MMPSPVAHPDAAMLAACAAFDRLELRHHELSRLDPEVNTPEGKRIWDELDAIQDAEAALLSAICNARALTVDGLRAKARSLCMWDEEALKGTSDYPHDCLRTSLLRDLLVMRDVPIQAGAA